MAGHPGQMVGRYLVNALDLQQCRAALDHEAFSGEFSLRRLDPRATSI
ncbi:hypothetical protein I551_5908 [Mycobacterium ulcerans str. Harvey]|uniref:Uncharacterized protein n=1 Tax=Mycobacterium ulcerans str. Harvey TaxID=1299332 RepID=A0ABN0QS94_MYCUL|nr:hypothetical protein I551_5908 [Mycobacterium ulcerans str. Harvey]